MGADQALLQVPVRDMLVVWILSKVKLCGPERNCIMHVCSYLTHTSLVFEITTLANFPKPVVTPYTTRKGREREREKRERERERERD